MYSNNYENKPEEKNNNNTNNTNNNTNNTNNNNNNNNNTNSGIQLGYSGCMVATDCSGWGSGIGGENNICCHTDGGDSGNNPDNNICMPMWHGSCPKKVPTEVGAKCNNQGSTAVAGLTCGVDSNPDAEDEYGGTDLP